MELSKEDVQNMLTIISKTTFVGSEAIVIATLQQKLTAMLNNSSNKDHADGTPKPAK